MRLALLALALAACGPAVPPVDYGSPGPGQDDVVLVSAFDSWTVAGCCWHLYTGLRDWSLESTSKVPLDCDAPIGTRARIHYQPYPASEPDVMRVEYLP